MTETLRSRVRISAVSLWAGSGDNETLKPFLVRRMRPDPGVQRKCRWKVKRPDFHKKYLWYPLACPLWIQLLNSSIRYLVSHFFQLETSFKFLSDLHRDLVSSLSDEDKHFTANLLPRRFIWCWIRVTVTALTRCVTWKLQECFCEKTSSCRPQTVWCVTQRAEERLFSHSQSCLILWVIERHRRRLTSANQN